MIQITYYLHKKLGEKRQILNKCTFFFFFNNAFFKHNMKIYFINSSTYFISLIFHEKKEKEGSTIQLISDCYLSQNKLINISSNVTILSNKYNKLINECRMSYNEMYPNKTKLFKWLICLYLFYRYYFLDRIAINNIETKLNPIFLTVFLVIYNIDPLFAQIETHFYNYLLFLLPSHLQQLKH